MIPVKPIDPDDLPLYAMQLLEPEQMEELTLQLQHSMEARRILAEIYADLALVAHTSEEHSPSTIARQKLLKQIAREKKLVPPGLLDRFAQPVPGPMLAAEPTLEDKLPRRTFGVRALPWVGWALAAGIGAFSFVQSQQTDALQHTLAMQKAENTRTAAQAANAALVLQTMQDPTAVRVTLTSPQTKPLPSGRVTYVPESGALLFLAANLAPLEPSRIYELWIIPSDGRGPMPAGTFKPDEHGNASVLMPEIAKGVTAKAFGVTIEEGQGSAVPTTPIILAGQPA